MSDPFRANPGSTLRIAAATGAGASPKLPGFPEGGGCQVRVRNRGTVEAFIEFGNKPTVAAAAAVAGGASGSLGLAPGAVEVWSLDFTQRFVAVAVETGTPAIEITAGFGG